MPWFQPDILDFFAELEFNNNREWFQQNKKRYEKSVKVPMEAFAEEMIERMRQLDPEIVMTPKDAVFRIYRDTRFSKDKTPYKTNAGISISPGGKTQFNRPGVYFHVDAHNMGVASGYYRPGPVQINAIRAYIASHLEEFAVLLEEPNFKTYFGAVAGEKNKILPQELKAPAAIQPILYNKQFYYWSEHEPTEVLRDDLPDFIIALYQAATPMNAFLAAALAG